MDIKTSKQISLAQGVEISKLREWDKKKWIALEDYNEMKDELNRNIGFQSDIIKKFGEELQYFQRQKGNVLFEIKLKKYREEIISLKQEQQKTQDKVKQLNEEIESEYMDYFDRKKVFTLKDLKKFSDNVLCKINKIFGE